MRLVALVAAAPGAVHHCFTAGAVAGGVVRGTTPLLLGEIKHKEFVLLSLRSCDEAQIHMFVDAPLAMLAQAAVCPVGTLGGVQVKSSLGPPTHPAQSSAVVQIVDVWET